MIVAAQPGPSVGVSPGTTTFQLGAAQAGVVCEAAERADYERMRERPPWHRGGAVTAAAQRVKNALSPYATMESLKGTGAWWRGFRRRLGNPTREITDAGQGRESFSWVERLSKVNDFRAGETKDYGFQVTDQQPYGLGRAGVGTPGYPNDRQLSTIWGYTPTISGQIPFTQGAWAPAPWVPPDGGRPAYVEAGVQAAAQHAGLGDVAPPPIDPATATLQTLQMHQDRMYLLGIISAAAVASTALVNVFRYSVERHDARKRHTRVAAEPAPSISGARYRRRR